MNMAQPLKNQALEKLLERLGGQTLSFPHPVEELLVVETHISTVLLAGELVYKLKKPIAFPFVDYSTLGKRRDFCQLEMDLNRRLADGIYLGVVPLTRKDRTIEVEGKGEPVEYAVKMRRLPDSQRLGSLLEKGLLPADFWNKLAYRLTRFYRNAPRGPGVSQWATPKAVEEDLRQVFSQFRSFPAPLLDPVLRERLEGLALGTLEPQKARIEKREGAAREGHGDLRLEHIYYFPGEPPPQDLAIIDCVEFDPRYRCGDPLLDIAFLVMDLEASAFRKESEDFARVFLKTSGELSTDHLLDFYVAYRHLVRGLVRGLHPPVLADRGLDAALSGLAALCPVSVTLSVQMAKRPSQTVEAIAYFIVAEALTNVAKHSGAKVASVTVRADSNNLRLVVSDDGRGGADPTGAGLAGLADRAQAVDGRLFVRSPLGGPTEIEAELPCG